MEQCLEKDEQFRSILRIVRLLYALAGAVLMVRGALHHSVYETLLAAATLLLIPGLYLVRRIFRWKGGWQLESYVYLFSFLGWTLGGAAKCYGLIPYYDKAVHCLSGLFVSVLVLAFYRMLEPGHSKQEENPATAFFFVFFGSMAVAGLFELCEFTIAPIMGRDLQHVMDTGVADTMADMFVCLLGTLVMMVLMRRAGKGKYDPFTGAAEAFAYRNPLVSCKSKNR